MHVLSARRRLLPALLMSALGSLAHAQSTTAMGEILVTAKRDDTKTVGTNTTVTATELQRRGAQDMFNITKYEALISVPNGASGSGSVWDSTGNSGFNIRGIDGNRVSMDLDGISLPDAAPKPDGSTLNAFGIGRDYFDPETFREVDITSGTTAAGSGTPGLGGSVSFTTKAPEDYVGDSKPVYADYKFGYDGSNNMRMHALTGAVQSGGLQALAVYVHRDGKELESNGNGVDNPDDWDSDALLAKLAWSPLAGHKLTATIDAYRTQHARAFINKTSTLYPEGVTMDSETKRDRFSLDHQFAGNTALFDTLESRIYYQDARVEDDTHSRYITQGQPVWREIATGFYNKSLGLASNAGKQFGKHRLVYGFSGEKVESRRPWREDRTVLATGAHQITSKNRMADTDTTKLALFGRADLALSDSITLTPGLRYDRRELEPKNLQNYVVAVPAAAKELHKQTDDYFTPSLALTAKLNPQLEAYAKYSRGTRLPNASEITGTYDSFSYTGTGNGYAVLGNGSLKKETSNAFELGLNGHAAPGIQGHAAVFYTKYKDFIEYVTQAPDPVNFPTITQGLFRPENIGDAKTWGVEVSGNFDLKQWAPALNGASVIVAAGVQHSKVLNTDTGDEGELASTLPRKLSATFAWDDPAKRGGGALSVISVHGKQAEPDVITGTTAARFAVPGYTVADLTAYWNIGTHAMLTAGIYNLTDKKYWDYASTRSLAAGTTAATIADIERQSRPGRYAAVTFKLIY